MEVNRHFLENEYGDLSFFLLFELSNKFLYVNKYGPILGVEQETIIEHTGTTGVLGPGFLDARRLAKLAVGHPKPRPQNAPLSLCVRLTVFALELFFLFEEMPRLI